MRDQWVSDGRGGSFRVRSVGQGPPVVVLHGGGIDSREYERFARALGEHCSVHLYDRRGRPGAPPLGPGHTVEVDVDDLARVLDHVGATRVIGHSGGAFVAARAALRLPVERLAVYDPGISIDGSVATAWFEPYRQAMRSGDTLRAMALVGAGADPDGAAARLPLPLQIAVLRLFVRTPVGRRMREQLPTVETEVGQIIANDAPAEAYAGITATTLLAHGARSASYFGDVCEALAAALPDGSALRIPRASHNAMNIARPAFVEPFAQFLTARTTHTS
ncbi:alpha/beta fold hydrolase [Aquipuribacter nitratireducens]|uniref:Alpha/beta fold hydrolase n=1 Tax=Aquipuribacter nitratireducens TaxID=650104 RepID=A0ABW0GJ67_9MICO